MKRVGLTTEQKAAVLKLFSKSKQMEQLVKEFKKTFKVLEGRGGKDKDPESYIVWSSALGRTIEIPTKELLG